MKFLVKRTSTDWLASAGDPPCEGAVLLPPGSGPHKTIKWGIEIKDLEGLVDFMTKQGHPVIVSKLKHEHGYADVELEIYDDYRE